MWEGKLLAKIDQACILNGNGSPRNRHLLGMFWEGSLNVDTVLTFGYCSTMIILVMIDTLELVMKQVGTTIVLHNIDNLVILVPTSRHQC